MGMSIMQAVDDMLARMAAEARSVQQAHDEELASVAGVFEEVLTPCF